jgi:hypothetical protein
MDEFKATAARLGCTTDDLLELQLDRAQKDPAFSARAIQKTDEIYSAMARHEETTDLWPNSLDECIVVAAAIGHLLKQGAEELVVELEGEEMDLIERVCQQLGISYDELMEQAIDFKLRGGANEEEDEDHDQADWWKESK